MVAQTMVRQLVSKVQDINLIGALPHIAEQAFNSIGGLNMAMHRLRKRIKRQQMLFVLSEASYRFWIAHSVLGFEGAQLCHCLLLCRLLPDANQFGLDGAALSSAWPLPGLPMQRVTPAPAAVLLELDAVGRVPLGLLGLVVAPLALGARERDPNSDSGLCHGFFFLFFALRRGAEK